MFPNSPVALATAAPSVIPAAMPRLLASLALLVLVFAAPIAYAAEQRIVAVGGAITEILFALGAEGAIVGVDTTSLWPPEAADIPQVGYQRNLSAEGVLSLSPTMLIATPEAGPPAVIKQLRQTGLRIEILDYEHSPDGVVHAVRQVAALLGREAQSAAIIKKIQSDRDRLDALLALQKKTPRVAFLLSVGRGTPLVSGYGTVADQMIRLSGAINAIDDFEGFKPLNAESLIIADPDLILMTERTLRLTGGESKVLALPGVAPTRAGQNARLLAMDGLYLLGFGPRVADAAADLNKRIQSAVID